MGIGQCWTVVNSLASYIFIDPVVGLQVCKINYTQNVLSFHERIVL